MDQTQQSVSNYLEALRDDAIYASEKGNKMGSEYLACIAGMWTHTLRRPNSNPFDSMNQGDLYVWFNTG